MNAKKEFILHTLLEDIKCATIGTGEYGFTHVSNLKEGYSEEDLNAFLQELDFDYNNGYGTQNLFGTIWYTDGTWSSRGEYDGSEWWERNRCPEIKYFEIDPMAIETVGLSTDAESEARWEQDWWREKYETSGSNFTFEEWVRQQQDSQ
jgi:hypothetical protein